MYLALFAPNAHDTDLYVDTKHITVTLENISIQKVKAIQVIYASNCDFSVDV